MGGREVCWFRRSDFSLLFFSNSPREAGGGGGAQHDGQDELANNREVPEREEEAGGARLPPAIGLSCRPQLFVLREKKGRWSSSTGVRDQSVRRWPNGVWRRLGYRPPAAPIALLI